jgi:hypothetical protein
MMKILSVGCFAFSASHSRGREKAETSPTRFLLAFGAARDGQPGHAHRLAEQADDPTGIKINRAGGAD